MQTKWSSSRYAILVATCLALYSGLGHACMVCIPFPENTATDDLLSADVVLLARENPDKPFSYLSVKTLKGSVDEPAIDFFVDSTTRRLLSLNRDDAVVLTFQRSTQMWTLISYASPAYQALVIEILQHSSEWQQFGSSEKRAAFFLPYLINPDLRIHKLAYLEVGRASYSLIRRADTMVPADQVHRFISDPQYLEWHALYILLLGIEASTQEAEMIRATMHNKSRFNQTLNLSAWATALIESDGEKGIEWLETHYLGVPGRNAYAIVEIAKALSVQGSTPRSALRERIGESYALLIETYPEQAGWVARDLTAWQDWRFADALASLRNHQESMDSSTAFAIDYYLGQAQSISTHQALQNTRQLP